ncbi:MAG: alpha/beta-hydrolase N-terminal domain-containing protein, partial [Glutamicibacter protophormiae]
MYCVPALGALALALLSLTPSMLPRTAVFQGVLCALAALLGYAAGALILWLLVSSMSASQEPRAARQQDASSPEIPSEAPQANPAPRTAGKAAAVLGVVLSAAGLVFYQLWQNDQREQLAMPHQSAWSLVYVVLVGVVLLALLLVICRFIRKISLALIEIVDKVLPRRVAAVIVVAAMVLG